MFKNLIARLEAENVLGNIINNPLAPFGRGSRQYLGQTLLPEKNVTSTEFDAIRMRFRSGVANAGTRYSPAQRKSGIAASAMHVVLGHSDIKSMFTAEDYDVLRAILQQAGVSAENASMEQLITLFQWFDKMITVPLIEHNEVNRFQALCNASVSLTGDDGYAETISYYNPTSHRYNAGGQWANDAYDPYDDLMTGVNLLASKGYRPKRLIWSSQAQSKFANNALVQQRVGRVVIASGVVSGLPGRASKTKISELFMEDGIPTPEQYDLLYYTDTGADYFLPRNKVLMIGETDQTAMIDLGDTEPFILESTVGSVAIGPAAGKSQPGRSFYIEAFDNKPPRIEAEGWQASIPVITEHEAVVCITLASDSFTSAPTAEAI